MRAGAASLLLLLAAAGPAHPLFAPTHDVSVSYRLETPNVGAPGGKTTDELRLHAIGGGELLRLDTPASGAYLLIDRPAQHATIVDPHIRAFMTGPLNPKVAGGLLLDPAASYRRIGRATVAGLACDLWLVGPGGADGSVCVTRDGVILSRVEGKSPAHQARLTALAVTYQAQPKSLFSPPPGYQDLSALKAPPAPGAPAAPSAPPPPAPPAAAPLPPPPPAPPLAPPTAAKSR